MAKKHAVQSVSPGSPNSRTYKSYSNSLFVAISTTSAEPPTASSAGSISQSVVTAEANKVEATARRLCFVLRLWGGQLLAAAQQHTADTAALADVRIQLAQRAEQSQAGAAAAAQARLQQQTAATAGAQMQPAAGQTPRRLLAQMERLMQGAGQQEVVPLAQQPTHPLVVVQQQQQRGVGGSAAGTGSTDSVLYAAASGPSSAAQVGHRHAPSAPGQQPDACHAVGSPSSSQGSCRSRQAGGVSEVSVTPVAAPLGSSAERLSLVRAELTVMEVIAAQLAKRTRSP
jgi:hypothetical protein